MFHKLDADLGSVVAADKLNQIVSSLSHSTAIRTPVSTACKSRRPRIVGESVMVHAEHRATEKDLGPSDTSSISSPKCHVLTDHPDSHFINVAFDSSIIFNSYSGTPSKLLSVTRANKIAQASFAKA